MSNCRPSSEYDSGLGATTADFVIPYVIGRVSDLDERCAARIVDVDHGRRVGRQHLEQPTLRREVVVHAPVEVEMVARQVGEDRRPRTGCRRRVYSASAWDETSITHAPHPASTISRMKA